MSGYQSLVGLGGIGLVAVNFWTGPQRQIVAPIITGGGNLAQAHTEIKQMAGELLLVVVVTVLAGLSNQWGVAMLAVVAGLFILWGIQYSGSGGSKSKTSTTSSLGGATT